MAGKVDLPADWRRVSPAGPRRQALENSRNRAEKNLSRDGTGSGLGN